MKCSYCGAEVRPDQKYCLYCGARQENENEAEEREWMAELMEYRSAPVTEEAAPAHQQESPAAKPVTVPPSLELPTARGLGKMFFLGILTLGIYPAVIWSRIVTELNIAASRCDGKRTMPYFAMCTLTPVTLGIYAWVWMHKFSNRVGRELARRGLSYGFGAGDFWLWGVLGSLIIAGPFVYVHKLMKAMNLINGDFNING